MGFLDRIFGGNTAKPRGRGQHGPRKSADERLKELKIKEARRQEEWLDWLAQHDPNQYNQIMQARLEIKPEQRDRFDDFISMFTEMKRLGMLPKGKDEGGGLEELVKLAPMIMMMLSGQGAQAGQMAQMLAAQQSTPTAAPTNTAAPPPMPASPAAYAPPEPPQPDVTEQEGGDEQMDMITSFIVGNLQGKTPEQAATWLLSFPQGAELARRLEATPDEQLPAAMEEAARQIPQAAGAINWLLQLQRRQWLLATVHAIRSRTQRPSVAQGL